jgi:hypothetical protein
MMYTYVAKCIISISTFLSLIAQLVGPSGENQKRNFLPEQFIRSDFK